jgi:Tol biopolymer transport system component
MTRAPGGHWKINLVSSEGGAPKQLIEGEINEGDPTWSPDGNRLAFGSNSDGFDKTPLSPKILLLDIGTGRVSELPGSEGKVSPRWSPDGRHMVAQSADMKELLLFDFTAGRWVVLARAELTNGIIIGWPHWSQDAEYVYFLSWGGNSAIYRIRVSDYKLERMASLKDMRLSLGVFGGWVGYAPDDSPVVLRHIGSQEIYALEWMVP